MAPAIVGSLIGALAVVVGVTLTSWLTARRERSNRLKSLVRALTVAVQRDSYGFLDPDGRQDAKDHEDIWDDRFTETQFLLGDVLATARGRSRRRANIRRAAQELNVLFSAGIQTIPLNREPKNEELVALGRVLNRLNLLTFGRAIGPSMGLQQFQSMVEYYRDHGLDAPYPPESPLSPGSSAL